MQGSKETLRFSPLCPMDASALTFFHKFFLWQSWRRSWIKFPLVIATLSFHRPQTYRTIHLVLIFIEKRHLLSSKEALGYASKVSRCHFRAEFVQTGKLPQKISITFHSLVRFPVSNCHESIFWNLSLIAYPRLSKIYSLQESYKIILQANAFFVQDLARFL